MLSFNVGTHLTVKEKPYKIVGIDTYSLINLNNEVKKWTSFTIVNKNERNGLSLTEGLFILWRQGSINDVRTLHPKFTLNWHFSGIAKIRFRGDKGVSKPRAELIWFEDNAKQDIFLLERFFHPKEHPLFINPYVYKGNIISSDDVKTITIISTK